MLKIIQKTLLRVKCVVQPTKWSIKQKRYTLHCCNTCRAKDPDVDEKRKNTNIKKYGHDKLFTEKQHLEKTRNTCQSTHGVLFPLQNKQIHQKTQQTCLEKYGSEYKQIISQKTLQTLNQRYNPQTDHNQSFGKLLSVNVFKQRAIETKTQKWLPQKIKALQNYVTPLFDISDYKNTNQTYPWKCVSCGTVFEDNLQDGKIPRCPDCFPLNRTNWKQREVEDFLKTLTNNVVVNDRTVIKPKELDFYLPDYNLAIEYNGLYWHSTLNLLSNKSKNYHLEKTKLCKEKKISIDSYI